MFNHCMDCSYLSVNRVIGVIGLGEFFISTSGSIALCVTDHVDLYVNNTTCLSAVYFGLFLHHANVDSSKVRAYITAGHQASPTVTVETRIVWRSRGTRTISGTTMRVTPNCSLSVKQSKKQYEPVREKTYNLGFNQVRHKPACTVTEDG